MYAQCDSDGNQYILLDDIVDFRKNGDAISLSDQKTTDPRGRLYLRRTTIGWQLCCEWKDGSTSWEKLSDLKESHPVVTAEFAVCQDISHESAFNYWVPYVLKKRDRIISLVRQRKTRYLKRNQKFGIELHKTVKEALDLDLDQKNGNTLWADAIAKEMKVVRIAFDILPDGSTFPKGYEFMKCHLIFDIKMEDFRRKAQLVAGGHMTSAPATMTHASVVSRETVFLALTIAALNALGVKAADIKNAYATAPITEKVWCILGPEFGEQAARKAIIVRALYGLKSAGAAFRKHLADCMRHKGYNPCLADPDLWMQPKTRPDDGFEYYSYMLIYVDDALAIDH
ncbi:hypothetical protein ACHAXR_006978 [Thalassiosira sp. AJA248-18]